MDPAVVAVGPRVKALREAEGLSLRDLAERSGVSAPMLSQVERGETSPTLQTAERIAAGLELRLSQLLRLDEDGVVSVVRHGQRRARVGGTAPLMTPTTLFDKIWAAHEVAPGLLYIDLHLVHEVTSPQAFDGLRLAGRSVRRRDRTLATADHNVPTDGTPTAARIRDELSRVQVETLERNCAEFGIPLHSLGSERQGIVHVIGPELGVTQPGMTIVCGDSHTATHGAFGALAFGIGTSEVEHVLATQCLAQPKPKSMRITYTGELGFGVTAKDLILATIGQMGVDGAAGHVVEFAGPAIESLSMEGRMTVCNMTIEGGGRAGMIAPDETTFAWVAEHAGIDIPDEWRTLRSDDGATFDREITVDAAALSPQVTWGTAPDMVAGVADAVPQPSTEGHERALTYMGLEAGTPIREIA